MDMPIAHLLCLTVMYALLAVRALTASSIGSGRSLGRGIFSCAWRINVGFLSPAPVRRHNRAWWGLAAHDSARVGRVSPEGLDRNPFCVIDGTGLIFRSFYAMSKSSRSGKLMTKDGTRTEALTGFIRMIAGIKKKFRNPKRMVVVFDHKDARKTRLGISSEYKSNRIETPEGLLEQFPLIEEFCHLAGIPTLKVADVEADDVIATLVTREVNKQREEGKGGNIVIVSQDKDLLPLLSLSDSVVASRPHKASEHLCTPAVVLEEFGVQASQMTDYLAIVGDPVDNIPGVKGLGKKAAQTLLKEHGSLKVMLDNLSKVRNATHQKKLRNDFENAVLSLKLVQLDCDVNIPPDSIRMQEQAEAEEHRETNPLSFFVHDPDDIALDQFFNRYELSTTQKMWTDAHSSDKDRQKEEEPEAGLEDRSSQQPLEICRYSKTTSSKENPRGQQVEPPQSKGTKFVRRETASFAAFYASYEEGSEAEEAGAFFETRTEEWAGDGESPRVWDSAGEEGRGMLHEGDAPFAETSYAELQGGLDERPLHSRENKSSERKKNRT
mmetsp:Transcript_37641/g.74011  ORF Transcript_37641/g.74011 Transcript_37641/m.74011 type:complete len:552 (+) Transcript_37641:109-1764(+)